MKRFVVILSILVLSTFWAGAQERTSKIELFPVPLKTNDLKMRMKGDIADQASTIELRNFIGKKLKTVKCDGKMNFEFSDMRQYPEGVYVVLVKGKNSKIIASEKFMISK